MDALQACTVANKSYDCKRNNANWGEFS